LQHLRAIDRGRTEKSHPEALQPLPSEIKGQCDTLKSAVTTGRVLGTIIGDVEADVI